MLTDEQKNTIADSLAIAIQDAAKMKACEFEFTRVTHYRVSIDDKGAVEFEFTNGYDHEHGEGWIPLEGG